MPLKVVANNMTDRDKRIETWADEFIARQYAKPFKIKKVKKKVTVSPKTLN